MYKNTLKKNFFFFKKFNNTLLIKGKKNNSEKIIVNFFQYTKKNKFYINNIVNLNSIVLKKAPIGSVRTKRFGKNYKKIPYLFNLSRSYKTLLNSVFSLKNRKKIKISKNLSFKKFVLNLDKSSKKKISSDKEILSLRESFLELNNNKSNFQYQW